MAHVFVVDDCPAVRTVLGARLRAAGHEVEELSGAEEAMERAVVAPPQVVVTDLMMAGLSGVQLCRLLRSDPATAHIPVILLTASGDRRSRFLARSAGAAAYVNKDRTEDLAALVEGLAETPQSLRTSPSPRQGRTLHERISSILDDALFESVVAGEVRRLASAGELALLFDGLTRLAADVLKYRWLAVVPDRAYAPVLVHGHLTERASLPDLARAAVPGASARHVQLVDDLRAVPGEGPAPRVLPLVFAGTAVGQLVVAPTAHGFTAEEERLLALVATELAGPLQMTSLYEDARRLASVDPLTGLLNRRAFLDVFDRERSRSERHGLPVSLLLVDVDHFKRVNDTYGHAAGDLVLRSVASALLGMARRTDVVARWGGEEFVLALPHTREGGARIAAERVRLAVAEVSHLVNPRAEPIRVTVSVGVASADAPWSAESLLAAADAGMYLAKARGRDRVEVAAFAEPQSSVRKLSLVPTA